MAEHQITLSQIVATLLEQGFHPSQIRRQLAARGIRWRYQFTTAVNGVRKQHQGTKERLRRLKASTTRYCPNHPTVPLAAGMDLCTDCLAAKWGPAFS